jgi:aerobic-type carbon monoxide dehydrogenase small subunit (CoxS/CutS family)
MEQDISLTVDGVKVEGPPGMTIIGCDGKAVETVEGIAQANHPLVETYVKHHAMQCGYCTPGFVVTAEALLDKNPHPSEDEIREALWRQSLPVRNLSATP